MNSLIMETTLMVYIGLVTIWVTVIKENRYRGVDHHSGVVK